MARRCWRAHRSHTHTEPRRGWVSSIQVSGGCSTVVPQIEQLMVAPARSDSLELPDVPTTAA